MKIYTKTGDAGKTSLIGGTRVAKYDLRIESYGTVDELSAWIGLIRDQEIDSDISKNLIELQDRLFTIESMLACDTAPSKLNIPEIYEKDIEFLEKEIDFMTGQLPELKSFLLPGGHTTVSYCHLARTVCRRAERLVIRLNEQFDISPLILKYLNRLSDYLFVLSRKIAVDTGAKEILWKPKGDT
jgi:cob(I)alamin adenosyltransferase